MYAVIIPDRAGSCNGWVFCKKRRIRVDFVLLGAIIFYLTPHSRVYPVQRFVKTGVIMTAFLPTLALLFGVAFLFLWSALNISKKPDVYLVTGASDSGDFEEIFSSHDKAVKCAEKITRLGYQKVRILPI
ncbi:hypothetical protein [Marinospirillum sp.]|uniref:hypothetical protein n=1 Tax=Marinospirillum sp. TaxID=2183934 RepID=UPI0025C5F93F|nr:hypothetical protein [Marinospirillum sp.]